jgi:xylulose-5-phosphate/fructose-6-phosphate phosphoketolase
MIYISGRGTAGPGAVAAAWLDGPLQRGLRRRHETSGHAAAVHAVLFPGRASPAHAPPETPRGSIHEGGELGYASPTPSARAFDNPDLVVAA